MQMLVATRRAEGLYSCMGGMACRIWYWPTRSQQRHAIAVPVHRLRRHSSNTYAIRVLDEGDLAGTQGIDGWGGIVGVGGLDGTGPAGRQCCSVRTNRVLGRRMAIDGRRETGDGRGDKAECEDGRTDGWMVWEQTRACSRECT